MYDKYTKVQQVTPGQSKLGKHKALLVVPVGSSTAQPGITMWAYNDAGGTFSLNMTFGSHLQLGPQIFPVEVYAVTEVTNGTVYRLN